MNILKVKASALEEQNIKSEAMINDLEKQLREKEATDEELIRDLERKLREKTADEDKLKDLMEEVALLTSQNRKLVDDIADLRRDKEERVKELEKTADDLVKVLRTSSLFHPEEAVTY